MYITRGKVIFTYVWCIYLEFTYILEIFEGEIPRLKGTDIKTSATAAGNMGQSRARA